ncbi:unnamed protein product [Anisakis simplex]|uniref:DUF222 domain-containing protein n=1 Tax=Anisakis simplex TaxID=6269 RepID=A0A0M3JCA2_ANISI|nr:unnamed protein product [Anisakis simplex]
MESAGRFGTTIQVCHVTTDRMLQISSGALGPKEAASLYGAFMGDIHMRKRLVSRQSIPRAGYDIHMRKRLAANSSLSSEPVERFDVDEHAGDRGAAG